MPHFPSSARYALSRRAIIFGTGSSIACARAALPKSSPNRLIGASLPAFSGTTVNGAEFDSNSSLGMVLVVGFFKGSCGSCWPALIEASAIYGDHRELVMVGVSHDTSLDGARSLVAQHALKFPVLFDPEKAIAHRLGVSATMTSLAVDRRGVLRWAGDLSQPATVREAAEALLDESA
jgi:peroxiredoxin